MNVWMDEDEMSWQLSMAAEDAKQQMRISDEAVKPLTDNWQPDDSSGLTSLQKAMKRWKMA